MLDQGRNDIKAYRLRLRNGKSTHSLEMGEKERWKKCQSRQTGGQTDSTSLELVLEFITHVAS